MEYVNKEQEKNKLNYIDLMEMNLENLYKSMSKEENNESSINK